MPSKCDSCDSFDCWIVIEYYNKTISPHNVSSTVLSVQLIILYKIICIVAKSMMTAFSITLIEQPLNLHHYVWCFFCFALSRTCLRIWSCSSTFTAALIHQPLLWIPVYLKRLLHSRKNFTTWFNAKGHFGKPVPSKWCVKVHKRELSLSRVTC